MSERGKDGGVSAAAWGALTLAHTERLCNLQCAIQAGVRRDLLVGEEDVHLGEVEGVRGHLGQRGHHRAARDAQREAALVCDARSTRRGDLIAEVDRLRGEPRRWEHQQGQVDDFMARGARTRGTELRQ
eukprot:scaffold2054_cov85-Isochrysis_galbana.AAC.2